MRYVPTDPSRRSVPLLRPITGWLLAVGALLFNLVGVPVGLSADTTASGSTSSTNVLPVVVPVEGSPAPQSPGPATPPPLPTPLPEWKLELMLEAPTLKHPSVVCVAPDGRVFVAEDPMDISTDRADEKKGRILCLHPGGRITTFADSLYAVFGMKYLDGKLYVLHNPKFSVFLDDGDTGKDRVDLIESTNPEPWAKDWNDHVPANFTLGMDGYFYVAVGDKGLYGAVGRDGRRIDMHGGGVVRIRPDGTGLEIFATGLRNIMDAAVNEEDEVFTYDNTDEKQWMSRLSHIVERGFYGYPYDFNPRQPYILWCMADYGAGAATGAFAETSGVLPGRYEGGLFLADFGKRQVTHVRLARKGGTYEALDPLDLFPNPPADFRPVGICSSTDGTAIYICDWQHRDDKEKVTVGRLFKLTHQTPKEAWPTPPWYTPAASGKLFEAETSELLLALQHPSRAIRLTAQRRLSERGNDAIQPLIDLLEEPRVKGITRCHAIWALDAIDEGEAGRAAIVRSIYSLDPAVRRQAVRQLGLRRVHSALSEFIGRLEDEEASVRFLAATALGRLADPLAIRPLRGLLEAEPGDEWVRFAAFTALNAIGRGNPSVWPRLVAGLNHPESRSRERNALVFRETFDLALVGALNEVATNRAFPVMARQQAIACLTPLHRQAPVWKGEWWAYHPVNQPPPARTVEWVGTPLVSATLQQLLRDPEESLRKLALAGIGTAGVTNGAAAVRNALDRERDPEFRRLMLETLGLLRDKQAVSLILSPLRGQLVPTNLALTALSAAQLVGSPSNEVTSALAAGIGRYLDQEAPPPILAIGALQALATLKDPASIPFIYRRLSDTNSEISIAAIQASVQVGGSNSWIEARLEDPRIPIRLAALNALGSAKARVSIPAMLKVAEDPALRDEAIRSLTAMPDVKCLDLFTKEINHQNLGIREAVRRGLRAIRDEAGVLNNLEAQADKFSDDQLSALRKIYEDHPTATRGKLFTLRQSEKRPEDYLDHVLSHTGDPLKGARVFANPNGLACIKCHRVQNQGGDIGPDLSQIGSQFDRKALAESVLWPSRVVREGYQQLVLELKDGESVAGLIKGESAESITLRDLEGKNRIVAKTDIQERSSSALSMMPEGLHALLSLDDFADLVAYLEKLK
ncbi:MAG: HEAT repeat domain-containing protein [Verrucomicrobiales bacterium]|nr:HEAT repeat domain-containing protein [Verrucomicrobiales bacterium]